MPHSHTVSHTDYTPVGITCPGSLVESSGKPQQTVENDCHPFGMQMRERSYDITGTGYRYGFNQKELDPNGMGGGGSTYDYGFRIFNPQIARFLSVDPLMRSYPWYTPYQFAGNKPIVAIDLDGLEEYVIIHYKQNNKIVGTAILHIPHDLRILKEVNKPDKYNGIMYIEVSFNPQKQLLSLDDKINAFKMVTRMNFSSIARSHKHSFQDNFDSCEEAMFEGLKRNFPESFEKLSNYSTDLYVFEPDADRVHFDSNSAILKSEYTEEVDNLIFLMKLFPKSSYEIGAHTDNVGMEAANMELSQNRAQSIVNYMIDKGIDAGRLFPVGYGESNPRADNSTEAGRALNRRVEFKAIDTGY